MTAASPSGPEEAVAPSCRNCGAPAAGAYCPNCGQETALALPSVRALLREAAGRYVALDGRLWRTVLPLLFRPGFLTREYFAGRRRRYIRPARLFLILSIALFALLRIAGEPPSFLEEGTSSASAEQNSLPEVAREERAAGGAGLRIDPDLNISVEAGGDASLEPLRRRMRLFNALPRQEKADQIFVGMLRYGPYAAFVLLPLFALLTKLAYAGRARRYPTRPHRYAAHLVFGAHNHAFAFLVAALIVLVPIGSARGALVLWASVYLLWSLKAVYGGRWSGVFARAALISVAYMAAFVVLVAGVLAAAIVLR